MTLVRHFLLFLGLTLSILTPCAAAQGPATFEPFEQWKAAVESNDAGKLLTFYSTNPVVVVKTTMGESRGPDQELNFWPARPNSGRAGVGFEIIKDEPLPDGTWHIQFQSEIRVKTEKGERSWYVRTEQLWQRVKDGSWRIVAAGRGSMARLRQPMSLSKLLYHPEASAQKDIAAALRKATLEHKNVLLDFGGNWCYDCHVLDMAFDLSEIKSALIRSYILVHVDIGEYTKNLDVAEKYKVPLKKGVPALVVLAADGKLLYSQATGEFENARSLAPEDILEFLNHWKPAR